MTSAPSAGFRRLASACVLATFALIVLGGIVRVTHSGLGCGPGGSGLSGWPLCRGDVLPGLELTAVIEYSHRALGSVVGLLVLALAVVAWRLRRTDRGIFLASVAAAVLVVAQGLLGAVVVERGLEAELVAAHLGLAMLLIALLLQVRRDSSPTDEGDDSGPEPPAPRLRALATAASVVVLATIVAGGYIAGTENYGRADRARTVGAHYACGTQFPLCNGELAPFGQGPLVDAQLTHRTLMYGSAVLVLLLGALVLRTGVGRDARRLALASIGVLVAQIPVGALNVWIAPKEPVLILAHLTLATLLWSAVVGLRGALAPAPVGSEPTPPPRRRVEAVVG